MADAKPPWAVRGEHRHDHLVAGLSDMQQEFSKNSELLLEVIAEVDASYAESMDRLSEALGHIQFQDVMRQRMEHVQEALTEMRDHMLMLAGKARRSEVGRPSGSDLQEMLAAHLEQYRMASQTLTHLAASGERHDRGPWRPGDRVVLGG